jgi:hypothetical protein
MTPIIAFIAGLTEKVLIVGPWIGGIIAIVITLALAPEEESKSIHPVYL